MFKKSLIVAALFGVGTHASYAQRFFKAKAVEVKTFDAPYVIESVYPMSNKLVIFVKYGGNNAELWASDGMPGGTVMLKDAYAGDDAQKNSPAFRNFVSLNGKYYISAPFKTGPMATDVDKELTVTDLTAGGTSKVDIRTGNNTVTGPYGFVLFDGKVFFNAAGADGAPSLHMHDGLSAPVAAAGLREYDEAVVMNNELYFDGTTGGAAARGLYKMSNAASAPVLVSDFAIMESLHVLGNKIVFWAQKETNDNIGKELYVSDGTPAGTVLLKEMVPGKNAPANIGRRITLADRTIEQFVVLNGNAFFKVYDVAAGLHHIYRTDGTHAGTVSIYSSGTGAEMPMVTGNRIVFNAYENNRWQLFATDGVIPPQAVGEAASSAYYMLTYPALSEACSYSESGLLLINGTSYANGGVKGNELLITDGTYAGTRSVKIVTADDGTELAGRLRYSVIGNDMYFVVGKTIYKTDLTALETYNPQLSVDNVHVNNKMKLYPNPLSGNELSIETGNTYTGQGQVSIYDMSGIKVFESETTITNGKAKIADICLPHSTYSIKLITATGVFKSLLVKDK